MDGFSTFWITSPCDLTPAGHSELFCSPHFCPFGSLKSKLVPLNGFAHASSVPWSSTLCLLQTLAHWDALMVWQATIPQRPSQILSVPALSVFSLGFTFLCRVHYHLWFYYSLSACLLYRNVNSTKVELYLIHSCNLSFQSRCGP